MDEWFCFIKEWQVNLLQEEPLSTSKREEEFKKWTGLGATGENYSEAYQKFSFPIHIVNEVLGYEMYT